jgi:hypothetical protein
MYPDFDNHVKMGDICSISRVRMRNNSPIIGNYETKSGFLHRLKELSWNCFERPDSTGVPVLDK